MMSTTNPHSIAEPSSQPVGVQRKRTKGYRMPPNTISVMRPSKWGNPHIVGFNCANAATAIKRYEHDLITLSLKDKQGVPLLHQIKNLEGKNLACSCPLDAPCHRNVLLKYANS